MQRDREREGGEKRSATNENRTELLLKIEFMNCVCVCVWCVTLDQFLLL